MKPRYCVVFSFLALFLTACGTVADTNKEIVEVLGSEKNIEVQNVEVEEVKISENNSNLKKEMKENGLEIEILKEGTGDEAKNGEMATVHYTGTLTDGTKFDSSVDRGTPFKFELGAGRVIKGWDQGVVGMKSEEKRKLTIPADLAYGDRATGSIPANSTLIFEVELIASEKLAELEIETKVIEAIKKVNQEKAKSGYYSMNLEEENSTTTQRHLRSKELTVLLNVLIVIIIPAILKESLGII